MKGMKHHYQVQEIVLPEYCCNYCKFCYLRGDHFCENQEDYVELRGLCDLFEAKPKNLPKEKTKMKRVAFA